MGPLLVNMEENVRTKIFLHVAYRAGSIGILWGKELWELYTGNPSGRWYVEGTPTFNPLFSH